MTNWITIADSLKGRALAVERAKQDERERIVGRIRAQICFDALADQEGRCLNHSGKCYELNLLIQELQEITK